MYVIIPEQVSIDIYSYGFYEQGLTKMIMCYVKPKMVFLDIGSHYGYYTLLASNIVGTKGRVHAFEPTPSTFAILQLNVSHKKNVITNNYAISSKSESVFLNDYGIKYSAFNSIYTARLPKCILPILKVNKYQIRVVSIDDYVVDHNIKPDFIKIDAESSEYSILVGSQYTIKKFKPIITIEVGDSKIKGVPSSKKLIEFLMKRNYEPYEFNNGKFQRHVLRHELYQYDNILFVPKK